MNELSASGVYTRAYLGSSIPSTKCASTTVRMTVWQRRHGTLNDYAYVGTSESQALLMNGVCSGSLQLDATLSDPPGPHDIIIKAQVVTTTTSGGFIGSENLPVEVEIR
ncbi:MAG: hypothetical protein JST00_44395 [Deltaproteobacteria bacterium]|nr:hypothetical protein [Deltaproteobacteria bacterium]